MRSISRLMLIIFSGFILFSCSNLQEPIPTNSEALLSVHPSGWLNKTSSDFHGIFIRTTQWNLANCQQCHGADYAGGIANSTCLTCHQQTPEDCIVCHGGVENLTGAPPLDLDDNTDVRSLRVGAHTTHLNGEQYSDGVECQQCHLVPGSYADPGHVDSDLPAELTFGDLATLNGALPNWDRNSATCADSYCHGNWSLSKSESSNFNIYTADEMTGNAAAPDWTDPIAVDCITCHNLPPTGHLPFVLNQCSLCHGSVINENGIFIDKSKHVNGKVNVFGQEFPMF